MDIERTCEEQLASAREVLAEYDKLVDSLRAEVAALKSMIGAAEDDLGNTEFGSCDPPKTIGEFARWSKRVVARRE